MKRPISARQLVKASTSRPAPAHGFVRLPRWASSAAAVASSSPVTQRQSKPNPRVSTPTPASPSSGGSVPISPRLRARNDLRGAKALFDTFIEDDEWKRRLTMLVEDLAEGRERSASVAFVGDSLSGTTSLVDALLDDPLYDETDPRRLALLDRYPSTAVDDGGRPRISRISYGAQVGRDEEGNIRLPSDWLKGTGSKVLEMIDPSPSPSTLDVLYASDILFFVFPSLLLLQHPHTLSRYTSPTLNLLRHFTSKPNTHVIVNRLSSLDSILPRAQQEELVLRNLGSLLPGEGLGGHTPLPSVHWIDTNDAHVANAVFRHNVDSRGRPLSRSEAVNEFERRQAASGVSVVRSILEARVDLDTDVDHDSGVGGDGRPPPPSPLARRTVALRLRSVQFALSRALETATAALVRAEDEVREVVGRSEVLSKEAREAARVTREGVLGLRGSQANEGGRKEEGLDVASSFKSSGQGAEDEVGKSLRSARKEVEEALKARLQWWKLFWKVDDVGVETKAAVERSFGRGLETKLVYETGRLLSLASHHSSRTDAILHSLSPQDALSSTRASPFHSALLLNTISASYPPLRSLPPSSLSEPLSRRREQLAAPGGPIDALQMGAQHCVLEAYVLGGSSVVASYWAAWTALLETPNAVGAASLATALAVWRLQGGWKKAQKRYWKAWDRVGDGLRADLESNLDRVLSRHVLGKPLEASRLLSEMVVKRRRRIEEAKEALRALKNGHGGTIKTKPGLEEGDGKKEGVDVMRHGASTA